MRKHLFSSLSLLLLFCGFFFFILNTPFIMSWYLPQVLRKAFPEVEWSACRIQGQSFVFPEDLSLHGLDLDLRYRDRDYTARIEKVTIYNILTFWKQRENLEILVENLTGKGDGNAVKKMNVKGLFFFRQAQLNRTEGLFAGWGLTLRPYDFENVQGRFRFSRNKLQLFEIKSHGYGGVFKGQLSWEKLPATDYVCWLEWNDVIAESLERIYPPLFGQVQGEIDGTLRLLGNADRVDMFALTARFARGGILGPRLVDRICLFPGNKVLKDELKGYRNPDGDFPLPGAEVRMQSNNNNRIFLQYTLEDPARQFQLKENQELFLPEGIKAVLFPPGEDTLSFIITRHHP